MRGRLERVLRGAPAPLRPQHPQLAHPLRGERLPRVVPSSHGRDRRRADGVPQVNEIAQLLQLQRQFCEHGEAHEPISRLSRQPTAMPRLQLQSKREKIEKLCNKIGNFIVSPQTRVFLQPLAQFTPA